MWLVLDVETSGLDPKKNALLEVGLVVASGDLSLLSTFDSLVKPYPWHAIEQSAMDVNKIDLDSLHATGRYAHEVRPDVEQFLNLAVAEATRGKHGKLDLLVHSRKDDFDLKFFEEAFRIPSDSWWSGRTLNLKALAIALGFDPCGLHDLRKAFGVDTDREHRALRDAIDALTIVRKMATRYLGGSRKVRCPTCDGKGVIGTVLVGGEHYTLGSDEDEDDKDAGDTYAGGPIA